MTRSEFEDIVQEAFDLLPDDFRSKIENVRITVEEYPSDEVLSGVNAGRYSLLGLYQGIPLNKRGTWYGMAPTVPDTIYLYQKNIEAQTHDLVRLRRKIAEVLFHELGHYFGMNEREVRQAMSSFL